jgi:hypothetical protein
MQLLLDHTPFTGMIPKGVVEARSCMQKAKGPGSLPGLRTYVV